MINDGQVAYLNVVVEYFRDVDGEELLLEDLAPEL